MSDNKPTPDSIIAPLRKDDNFKLMIHAHNVHAVTIPQYMTKEQLENPKFWALVGPYMKVHDRIEVVSRDGSMLAKGLVKFAQKSIINVQFYEHHDLDAVAQPEIKINGFTIRQISATAGWEIIDDMGNALKDEGLPTQESAMIYLNDHQKHVA